MSGRKRAPATPGDMVRTLLVFLVILGGIYLLLPKHKQQAVKPVAYKEDLAVFTRAAPYPPLVPTVPDGWTVTSIRGQLPAGGDATLHLGLVTPAVHYVALEESDSDAEAFVRTQTAAAGADGTVDVDGVSWQRWRGPKGVSLTRTAKGVTVVLTGGATEAELVELARTLHPGR